MIRNTSDRLFERAKELFPGGVNSPVRAFKSVLGSPLFIEKGDGCHIYDADGNKFIDFCCSWGPLILGHNNPLVKKSIIEALEKGTSFGAPTRYENTLGGIITANNKFIDKIRFVSSGTEAVMSAMRLARGYSGKDKIIKFEGCYHGHVDYLLVKAGSGLATFGESSSAGVPEAFAKETLVLPLNEIDVVEDTLKNSAHEIAAIIIEPIPANNGLLLQGEQYLKQLRELCTKYNVLLIFDEVISGFRYGFEGAAGVYNIKPDIATYGKILGGGMPVGAYGASNEIMASVSPDGPVYQAGTLSGNPVAMAAGIAQLTACLQEGFYEKLATKTQRFTNAINEFSAENNYAFKLVQLGSVFWFAFSDKQKITKASQIDASSMSNFTVLHNYLLNNGVYVGPSGYEVGFVSAAHTEDDLYKAQQIICDGLDVVFKNEHRSTFA